jgi:hypothetical protein
MQPESVVVDALLAVLAVIKGRVEQVGATFSTAFYILTRRRDIHGAIYGWFL